MEPVFILSYYDHEKRKELSKTYLESKHAMDAYNFILPKQPRVKMLITSISKDSDEYKKALKIKTQIEEYEKLMKNVDKALSEKISLKKVFKRLFGIA